MKQPRVFLTAEWRNLAMLNYAVDPGLLRRFVPAGTELDAFDEKTLVSLVGFEFNGTRVAGLAIPFHRSFEEVNLRFYVRRGERRGVVFIRELVPRFAIATAARWVYGENYSCVPMSHRICGKPEGGTVEVEYAWGSGANACAVRIEVEGPVSVPGEGSLGQFITEHYWGYSAQRGGGCLEYEVRHPRWNVRGAKRAQFSGDPTRFYGAEFANVLAGAADSAFLAEGSEVTVFRGARVE